MSIKATFVLCPQSRKSTRSGEAKRRSVVCQKYALIRLIPVQVAGDLRAQAASKLADGKQQIPVNLRALPARPRGSYSGKETTE